MEYSWGALEKRVRVRINEHILFTKTNYFFKKMTLLLNEFEFLKISVATFDDVIVSTQAQVQALRTQGAKDNAQLSLVQRDARKASAKIADDQQRVLALQATNKALRRSVAERQADADVLALRLSEKADTLGSGDGSAALVSEASVNLALRAQLAALEKQGIASALSLEIVSVQLMQANKTYVHSLNVPIHNLTYPTYDINRTLTYSVEPPLLQTVKQRQTHCDSRCSLLVARPNSRSLRAWRRLQRRTSSTRSLWEKLCDAPVPANESSTSSASSGTAPLYSQMQYSCAPLASPCRRWKLRCSVPKSAFLLRLLTL